ncbi:MAG TPA: hypothetical protein PKC21_05795 [Oligoflexia bacterium]|nr:hypothetical protein [Oligoflexia bacterium]HMR24848.1 hypothetical protein [Oligoflexia bacterium]
MKYYFILIPALALLIVSCSVFAKKPKLYSHKHRIMTLCCKSSSANSCSSEHWKARVKKHCPAGATQINQDTRERLKYTELPQSGLYEQHAHNYDFESSNKKSSEFILKKQTLNCINYQCNGPVKP